MEATLAIHARDGVSVAAIDGAIVFEGFAVRVGLKRPIFARLASPVALTELTAGADDVATMLHALTRLAHRGLLAATLMLEGKAIATLAPISPALVTSESAPPGGAHVLSRFVYLRPGEGALVLESPHSRARMTIHDERVAALVHRLARGDEIDAPLLLALLHDGGFMNPESPALETWEHHDLLFHARTRNGRHDYAVGGTFRFLDRLPPPAATRRLRGGPMIALDRPLSVADAPFQHVYDTRESIRTYDNERPITKQQLGELLFRVARIEESFEGMVGAVPMQFITRPYPTGGGLHELEFYLVIARCDGIERALYRYEGVGHRLEHVSELTPDVERLLGYARDSTGTPIEELQVMIVLAARFDRIAWKYSAVAYSLVLKNVGVVYQSLYLAATAMGLAPCALGGGDADLFARVAGTDYYAETSVGEFLIGSRAKA